MTTENPNCDGGKCRQSTGEVRVLSTGEMSNAILCRSCYEIEMAWRRGENMRLAADARYDLPQWDSLEVYSGAN